MITGGCHDANGSDGALTVVLAPRGGSATRYDCTAIGRDSMFTLARSYHMMAGRLPKRLRAQQATVDNEGGDWGSWEYFRFEREFCYVDLVEGTVYYCGIWYTYEGFVWIGGGGGGATGGTSEGGSGGVTTTGGTTTGITPLGPGPTADEVPVDGCNYYLDKQCHVPLTEVDIANLNLSYQYLRDTTGVWADTVAQRQCLELFRALQELRSLDPPLGVWRGKDSIPNPATAPVHDAQSYEGAKLFHLDPPTLDKATTALGRKFLLSTALHETAHAIGGIETHQTDDYTGVPYFMYTSLPGPNSCVLP